MANDRGMQMKVTLIKSGSLGLSDGTTKFYALGEQEVTKGESIDLEKAGMIEVKPAPKSRRKANG